MGAAEEHLLAEKKQAGDRGEDRRGDQQIDPEQKSAEHARKLSPIQQTGNIPGISQDCQDCQDYQDLQDFLN
jgi:hypothetical protein